MMSAQLSSLLGLPLELRFQIYEICFDTKSHRPQYSSEIASVCRQTRMEAFPLLFQLSRNFDSIESFVDWTSNGYPHLLLHVKDIFCHWTIHSPLLPVAKTSGMVMQDHSSASPNESELLERALPSYQNLRRLGLILDLVDQTSKIGPSLNDHRYEDQETLLRMISKSCPKIEFISLVTDLMRVEPLQWFRNLVELTWSGYSLSTPQETLSILNSLPRLNSIAIQRWPIYYDSDTYSVPTGQLYKYYSFTSDVLQGLRPLKSLCISHPTSDVPSHSLTTATLRALSSHRQTLVYLKLVSDHLVEGPLLEEIRKVISTFNLERVWLYLSSVPKEYTDPKGWAFKSRIAPSVKYCKIHLRYVDGDQEVDLRHEFS